MAPPQHTVINIAIDEVNFLQLIGSKKDQGDFIGKQGLAEIFSNAHE